MNYLFSPWRMKYVTSEKITDGCVFCEVLALEDSPENLVIHRGEYSFVIINRFPYTSGHLMVVPYEHQPRLDDLTPEIRAEMMEFTSRATQVLDDLYHPQGFNIGINLGEAGGAGIEPHVHMHIVPRWFGDTNFMTAVGSTRVVPEALDKTWERVHAAWAASKDRR